MANKSYKEVLEDIVKAGKWIEELEDKQDPAFPLMILGFAKDCYRKAKNSLNENDGDMISLKDALEMLFDRQKRGIGDIST